MVFYRLSVELTSPWSKKEIRNTWNPGKKRRKLYSSQSRGGFRVHITCGSGSSTAACAMSKYWPSPGLSPLQQASSVPNRVPALQSSRSTGRGRGTLDRQRPATTAPAGGTAQRQALWRKRTSGKWKTRGLEIKSSPSSSCFQLSAGACGAAVFQHPAGSSSRGPLWP